MSALSLLGALHTHRAEHPLHYLFSPTALSRDLVYIDKTYYNDSSSSSPRHSFTTKLISSSSSSDKSSIASMHTAAFNKAVSVLKSISRLDLRDVGLFSLPSQIASLTRLTVLELSHNRLDTLPPAIHRLKHLQHLDLSHNRITYLPSTLERLSKLTYLDLSCNPLNELPICLSKLSRLSWLNVSETLIDALPVELLRLPPATIKMDRCDSMLKIPLSEQPLAHDPPSLAEQCARQWFRSVLLLRNRSNSSKTRNSSSGSSKKHQRLQQQRSLQLLPPSLPEHLRKLLSNPYPCSFCQEPFFEHCVVRYRIVHRADDTWVPIKYRLCCAHWADDSDRILALFANQPSLKDWDPSAFTAENV